MTKISVLMSVYNKEKANFLKQSLHSLKNQTYKASEVVIVEDGPLTNELIEVIDDFKREYEGVTKVIKLDKNVGLGLALREGMLHCTYEVIARQDSDDISVNTRFEKEVKYIENGYDIVGSQIHEFIDNINNIVSDRIVPLTEEKIIKFQKYRCAFNHMTVMFKKCKVLEVGNYEHAPYEEDDILWSKMIMANAKMINIDDFLVFARVGKELYMRRGGYEYFKNYKTARYRIYKLGFINHFQYLINIIIQFIICIIPNNIRKFIFINFLRNKYEN